MPTHTCKVPSVEGRAAWANFGTCFFGVILTSLFGLPLILYHVGKLTHAGLGLWLGSTVVTFVASVSSAAGAQRLPPPYARLCLPLGCPSQIWYWLTRTKGQMF